MKWYGKEFEVACDITSESMVLFETKIIFVVFSRFHFLENGVYNCGKLRGVIDKDFENVDRKSVD